MWLNHPLLSNAPSHFNPLDNSHKDAAFFGVCGLTVLHSSRSSGYCHGGGSKFSWSHRYVRVLLYSYVPLNFCLVDFISPPVTLACCSSLGMILSCLFSTDEKTPSTNSSPVTNSFVGSFFFPLVVG